MTVKHLPGKTPKSAAKATPAPKKGHKVEPAPKPKEEVVPSAFSGERGRRLPAAKKPGSKTAPGKGRKTPPRAESPAAAAVPLAPAPVERLTIRPAAAESDWESRFRLVIGPALLDGLVIYTGLGELLPGPGISNAYQSPQRPAGLPNWQVYLDSKEEVSRNSSEQPGIRFLQFVQRARNPEGSTWQSYRTPGWDKIPLGFPLIVPLGEGMETPTSELTIARDLAASILYKTVRTVAIGRCRFYHTRSTLSYSEPVLMEVYDEDGKLLWRNPFAPSLEEALAMLRGEPVAKTRAAIPTSRPAASPRVLAPSPVTASAAPKPALVQPRSDQGLQGALHEAFSSLALGTSKEDAIAQISHSLGVHAVVVGKAYDRFMAASSGVPNADAIMAAARTAQDAGLDDEDLVEAVIEMVGVSRLEVKAALNAMTAMSPAPAPSRSLRAPQFAAAPESTAGVMSLLGVPLPQMPPSATPLPEDKEAIRTMKARIREDLASYQNAVLIHLQGRPNHSDRALGIRDALGLPGGVTGGLKTIADLFRRAIMDPLVKDGKVVVVPGTSQRQTTYRLP